MLLELSIKNFAIIEDVRIEFGSGLNVLTGETGSGKSIIIDALSMLLGQRSSKDVIKKGKDFAYVEAIFTCYEDLEEIDFTAGDLIIISKEIKTDRPAISKINGRTVNNSTISRLSSKFIDIFAQHESVSLMQNANQMELLDSFSKDLKLREYSLEFEKLKKLRRELEENSSVEKDRDREIDLLNYQIQEIEDASLTEYDDEKLEEDYKKISNSTDIVSELSKSVEILKSYENVSVETLIDEVVSSLSHVKKYDSSIEDEYSEAEDIRYRLSELASNLNSHLQRVEFDPEKLLNLENRLNLVNNLKKKYGQSISEINNFLEKTKERFLFLKNFEEKIDDLKRDIKKSEETALKIAREISNDRRENAKRLEEKIREELIQLDIKNASFKVDFSEKEMSEDGIDKIDFMIRTNLGEDYKSLAKTASGGEMSRIMLGFKSILAEKDNIQTLIFDEIDTGISGRTAMIVGNKIKSLSKNRQIIAISHLPQIVSLADRHYLIEKTSDDVRTISTVRQIREEERVRELARLIGGMEVTETALQAARELIAKGEIDG